jgi:hypothetical protein
MDVFLSFIFIIRIPVERLKKVTNDQKSSGRVMKRSETVNGQERLGTLESERSNSLERTVENGHGTFTIWSRSRFKNESQIEFVVKVSTS